MNTDGRSVFRRWTFWFLVAIGLIGGFAMFCLPELQLKSSNPEGWQIMWGASRVSTCTRCVVFSALEGLGVAIIFVAVYFFFPRLRRRASS